MATPFVKVYEAFLARITADEWTLEEELAIVERDWQQLLDMAIFRFKYPRKSLKKVEVDPNPADENPLTFSCCFEDDLDNDEIQMLALYMKHEWIKRCIANWENLSFLYSDAQFSQANHLDKLNGVEKEVALEIHKAEGIYDRSRNKRPSENFSRLAGKRNVLRNIQRL